MHANPQLGVVDAQCQVHGIANLLYWEQRGIPNVLSLESYVDDHGALRAHCGPAEGNLLLIVRSRPGSKPAARDKPPRKGERHESDRCTGHSHPNTRHWIWLQRPYERWREESVSRARDSV